MRIIPNDDGRFLIILEDNSACSFVGARPQPMFREEPNAAAVKPRLADAVIAAWSNLTTAFQRPVRYGARYE